MATREAILNIEPLEFVTEAEKTDEPMGMFVYQLKGLHNIGFYIHMFDITAGITVEGLPQSKGKRKPSEHLCAGLLEFDDDSPLVSPEKVSELTVTIGFHLGHSLFKHAVNLSADGH